MEYAMSKIAIEEKENYKIVSLLGDFIGGEETEKLSSTLKKIAEGEKNRVVLNLHDVTFLNSMALGVLLSANALFNKNKGKVVLCNASEYLRNIFETTKLSMIFSIDASLDEAIKSIQK